MEELQKNYPIEIFWRSFELIPKGAPPLSPEYKEYVESKRPEFEKSAKDFYGIEINPGPYDVDSRPAMIGAKFAEKMGKGKEYHQAIFHAYWKEAKRIDDLEVLAHIAVGVGLDKGDYLAAIGSEEYEDLVDADIYVALQSGQTLVPSMVFNSLYLVRGAQPYENLEQAVEKIMAGEADN